MSKSLQEALSPTRGRPKNHFSMLPSSFKEWFNTHWWRDTHTDLLKEGGTLGMEAADGKLQVELLSVHGHLDYVYVRVTSHDEALEFTTPGPLRVEHLSRLFEVWELEKFKWTESTKLGTPAFPLQWSFRSPFTYPVPSAEAWFCTLHGQGAERTLHLNCRAGWVTALKRNDPDRQLVGLMGTDMRVLQPVLDAAKRVGQPLLLGQPMPYTPELFRAMLEASATYLREKLLVAPKGKMLPFVPHAEYIGLPTTHMGGIAL